MSWFRENRFFVMVFFVALAVRLVLFPGFHEVWWDSGAYVGMGKFFFSLGQSGVWEHIRPLVWSFVLGFLWFVKLSPVFFGRVFELILGLGCIFLFYCVSNKYFDKNSSILATVIFSFSSIFLYLNFHLYTEIPALFLVLFAVFCFEREFYSLAGFSAGLAFITKFPAGLFLIPLLAVLFIRGEIKNTFKILVFFLIPASIFFVFNFFMYGHPLLPLIDAKLNILSVLGCNVMREKQWWFYFAMIFRENWFHVFAPIGLFVFLKKFRFQQLLPFLCMLLPLIYFTQMHCKDYRYMMLFVPFIAMFSGAGISALVGKRKNLFIFILILLVGFSAFKGVWFYADNEVLKPIPVEEDYFRFLADKDISGEVWSSNPVVSVYSDALIKKIYYPIYASDSSVSFNGYLRSKGHLVHYVLLDNCGGGIICHPDDAVCASQLNETLSFLDSNFNNVYNETCGRCFYKVYENPLF